MNRHLIYVVSIWQRVDFISLKKKKPILFLYKQMTPKSNKEHVHWPCQLVKQRVVCPLWLETARSFYELEPNKYTGLFRLINGFLVNCDFDWQGNELCRERKKSRLCKLREKLWNIELKTELNRQIQCKTFLLSLTLWNLGYSVENPSFRFVSLFSTSRIFVDSWFHNLDVDFSCNHGWGYAEVPYCINVHVDSSYCNIIWIQQWFASW